MNFPALLYVFEGPDGVGKTTLAHALVEYFTASSVRADYYSFPGKEEGTLGHFVYDLHHRVGAKHLVVDPTSLQLMHIAAHIDAIERQIRPALESGVTVVLDRFWWSTWIYGQSSGANASSLSAMIDLERAHWQEILPSAIFVVERASPFDEAQTPEWDQLAHAYREATSRQDWGHRVHRIRNESTIGDALNQVIENL